MLDFDSYQLYNQPYPIKLPVLLARIETLKAEGTVGLLSPEIKAEEFLSTDFPEIIHLDEEPSFASLHNIRSGIIERAHIVVAPTEPITAQKSLDRLTERILNGLDIPIQSTNEERARGFSSLYARLDHRNKTRKIFTGRATFLETVRRLRLVETAYLATHNLQEPESDPKNEELKKETTEVYHHRSSSLMVFPSIEVAQVYLEFKQAEYIENFRTGVFDELGQFVRVKFIKNPQDLRDLLELALMKDNERKSERGRELVARLSHVWGRKPFEPFFPKEVRKILKTQSHPHP